MSRHYVHRGKGIITKMGKFGKHEKELTADYADLRRWDAKIARSNGNTKRTKISELVYVPSGFPFYPNAQRRDTRFAGFLAILGVPLLRDS